MTYYEFVRVNDHKSHYLLNCIDLEQLGAEMESPFAREWNKNTCKDTVYAIELVGWCDYWQSIYSREYIKQRSYYNSNLSQFIFFNKNDLINPDNDAIINFEMKYFKESIIDEMGIIFGPGNRIKQDGDFFNKLQAYEHHKKQIKNGMYVYSFSLHPNELQPSGFCDFSNIDNIALSL